MGYSVFPSLSCWRASQESVALRCIKGLKLIVDKSRVPECVFASTAGLSTASKS